MPRPLTTFALFLPFALSILVAYAWFNTDIGRPASSLRSPASGIWLSARTNIPGYTFIPEPVSDFVKNMLRTREIREGMFRGAGGQIFRAFWARWENGNRAGFEGLNHTPDVCWRSAGWRPIPMRTSRQISLSIGATDIPFEVRTFQSSDDAAQETVIWCVIVDGRALSSPILYTLDPVSWERRDNKRSGYYFLLSEWAQALRNRARGPRIDFFRLSTPVLGDLGRETDELKGFVPRWLTVLSQGDERGAYRAYEIDSRELTRSN